MVNLYTSPRYGPWTLRFTGVPVLLLDLGGSRYLSIYLSIYLYLFIYLYIYISIYKLSIFTKIYYQVLDNLVLPVISLIFSEFCSISSNPRVKDSPGIKYLIKMYYDFCYCGLQRLAKISLKPESD